MQKFTAPKPVSSRLWHIDGWRRKTLIWAMTGGIDMAPPFNINDALPQRMQRFREDDPRREHVEALRRKSGCSPLVANYIYWRGRLVLAQLLLSQWPTLAELQLVLLMLPELISRVEIDHFLTTSGGVDLDLLNGAQRWQLMAVVIELARCNIVGSLLNEERMVLGFPTPEPLDQAEGTHTPNEASS